MGRLKLPFAGPVYLDSNILIHPVERHEPYREVLNPLWLAVEEGTAAAVTSELSLVEILTKPIRENNSALAGTYRELILNAKGIHPAPVSREVLTKAAEIRAHFGLKTPDAIHAATALLHPVALFLTNDSGFKRVPCLPVVLADELINPE